MNTMNANPPVSNDGVPSSQNFTLVGICYGLYAIGLFLVWTTLVGLVIAYVKRDDVPPLLSSHYRWLINTFWWSFVALLIIIGAVAVVMVPNAIEISSAVESGQYFNIPWELIGTAVFGGLAIPIIWLWVVYRLIRGAIRLADGSPAP